MLFTGSSEHTIDDKKRLSIASKHRAVLPESVKVWYCMPWPTGVLRLYPEPTFLELAAKWNDSLTLSDEESQLVSTMFGIAERLEMDSAGRVKLPQNHLDLVGLGSDVVVLGSKSKLEITDREKWQAGERQRFEDLRRLVAMRTHSSGS